MKPIERARAELDVAKASGEHADFMKHFELVLNTAGKLKQVMVSKGLSVAKAKCPKCQQEALHGRLITGFAAGRHRRSGGAFRMWCDNCTDIAMME